MRNHRARNKQRLVSKTAGLALAVPQIMAHRLTRMAIAGNPVSERDRREFNLMSAEKTAAFTESWIAMAIEIWRANQALAMSAAWSFWFPWLGRPASARSMATQWNNAAYGVLDHGMRPVHRRVVANASRLARTALR